MNAPASANAASQVDLAATRSSGATISSRAESSDRYRPRRFGSSRSDNGALGAVWTGDDEIVFAGRTGLQAVSAQGGKARDLTHIDSVAGERSHRTPCLFADGTTIVVTIHDSSNGYRLALTTLGGGTFRRTDVAGSQAIGFVDGRLIYLTIDGNVLAVPFERATGPALPVIANVGVNTRGAGDIGLSPGLMDGGSPLGCETRATNRGTERAPSLYFFATVAIRCRNSSSQPVTITGQAC